METPSFLVPRARELEGVCPLFSPRGPRQAELQLPTGVTVNDTPSLCFLPFPVSLPTPELFPEISSHPLALKPLSQALLLGECKPQQSVRAL